MSCQECAQLQTHEFRGPADMVHAFQVAAGELDRGVLRRVDVEDLGEAERAAMDSVIAADAFAGAIRYRFACTVCGDRFELWAETGTGRGAWTRHNGDACAPLESSSRSP